MTSAPTVPLTGPLDGRGRLLHEDDPAAQLALAVTRFEAAMADLGVRATDLTVLRVLATDRAAVDAVVDVLTERLHQIGATPALVDGIEVVGIDDLGVKGMLLALEAGTGPVDHTTPSTTRTEGTSMNEQIATADTTTNPALDRLRGACEVHLPGEPGYEGARTPWNLAADLRPAAVAVPRSVDEVVAVMRAAVDAGLRVAPLSTGHGAGPLAAQPLGDVVVVRLGSLTGVTVDPTARTARVVGGTAWGEVVEAAAPHGLTALHGSAPGVAAAGYLLGGGVSFYGRRHGLAANSLRAVELVTAAGELVRADHTQHQDLFWAVRGGGGGFGVVVALEIDLLPVSDAYAGMLLWDRERAPEVVAAWARWTREAPESATTSLRVMSFPDRPELPPFLSGRSVVIVDGAVLEDDDRAAEVLAPLRDLDPEMDTFARIPAAGLLAVHMDPPAPVPAVGDHALLAELPPAAVDALLAQVGPGTTSGLLFAELRHLGGALSRPVENGGAVSHVDAGYSLGCIAMAPTPEAEAVGRAAGAALVTALAPWSTPARLLTFTEVPGEGRRAWTDEAHRRLVEVRDAVDPDRRLVANHPVD